MNDTTEDNPIDQIMEIIIEQGFGGMDQAMTILINEAMKIERSHVLQATAYERTPHRWHLRHIAQQIAIHAQGTRPSRNATWVRRGYCREWTQPFFNAHAPILNSYRKTVQLPD
ncbi:MAG: hypothetical protein V3V05_09080 [Pontiella sp.]